MSKLTKEQKEHLKKWDGLSKEELIKEEDKWSKFLWLGRHLAFKHTFLGQYLASGNENKIRIAKGAARAEADVICTYGTDPDFIRCMINVESENGDKEWDEILNNVGSLRYLICGEWFTDS